MSHKGKRIYLGRFDTPAEASAGYLKAKATYVEELLVEFPQPYWLAEDDRTDPAGGSIMRLIHGWGISDVVYVGDCPIHKRWVRMIADPCRVDECWKYFTVFRAWYLEQTPKSGYRLNKVILGAGKLYSPETCCLVPKWLNTLFSDHRPNRGPWPQGVSKVGWKYVATLSRKGKRVYLRGFITPQEASVAYLEARLAYAEDLLAEFPQPIRVASAIRLKMRGLLEREESLCG